MSLTFQASYFEFPKQTLIDFVSYFHWQYNNYEISESHLTIFRSKNSIGFINNLKSSNSIYDYKLTWEK